MLRHWHYIIRRCSAEDATAKHLSDLPLFSFAPS
uniref:Uncharacterized protein n=1 Tax=Anguilla anguilla TaxID=7936 RepID=A0A0E9UBK6_ANGAN